MIPHLTDTPVLETERLALRIPRAEDFDWYRPFVMSDRARYVGGGADKGEGHAWRMLAIITGHWHLRGFGTFVAVDKATDQPIGSIGPWYPADWPEHELGWTIWDPAYEGRGYAAEAVVRTRDYAFRDLGWDTAVSYIAHGNDRSVALAERLGAVRDDSAATPDADPTYVYRHPHPGGAA